MDNLNRRMMKFRDIIIDSWGHVLDLGECQSMASFKDDFLQVMWELVVETPLWSDGVFLEPYGDGADCHGVSSRVIHPEKIPNHRIVCRPKVERKLIDALKVDRQINFDAILEFERFVTLTDDGWFNESPPFDRVQVELDGEIVLILAEDVDFIINPI